MGWTYSDNVIKPVVKENGLCRKPSQHKFCPYWVAKHSLFSKENIIGYKCALFNEDKNGYAAVSACNRRYGRTYDGKP